MTIEIIAARPGVLALPRVSSFMVRQVSQPQYMKIDRESPAVKALNEPTSSGLSQPGRSPRSAAGRHRRLAGGDAEQQQDGQLQADQAVLEPLGGGHAPVAHRGGAGDQGDHGEQVDGGVVAEAG